jgi:hypothetical protein
MGVAVTVLVAAGLVACGPDETIDLLPTTSSSGGGEGGHGGEGAGGEACERHVDCATPTPWCDLTTEACAPCPDGLVLCGGECVDTVHDSRHCNGCFEACDLGQHCEGSACHCDEGLTNCLGLCRDFSSDPDHCGSCEHPCDPGEACSASLCVLHCDPGLDECPASDDRIACVNLEHGPRCGSCDVECGPGEVCVTGTCRAQHPATPCLTCPCPDVCDASLGSGASCCEGVHGAPHVSCVAGAACP